MDTPASRQQAQGDGEGDEADLPAGTVTMAVVRQGSRLGASWFDPCTCAVRKLLVHSGAQPGLQAVLQMRL